MFWDGFCWKKLCFERIWGLLCGECVVDNVEKENEEGEKDEDGDREGEKEGRGVARGDGEKGGGVENGLDGICGK